MFAYRLLLSLAAPYFVLRLWRGGRAQMVERLGGNGPGRMGRGLVIWLHAASNGEATAARPLIDALLARDDKLTLIVTCNSETGRALVRGWGLARVSARLAPLDYRLTLRRFIGNWQPDALILIESELWPNRMAAMRALSRPVVVLSARMSDKSAATWGRMPGLARQVIGAISYLSAQDAASEARFQALGLPEDRTGPVLSLKTRAAPGGFDADEKARLAPLLPRVNTVLAASTHEGEEQVILLGFRKAHARRPDLRLILAPRHPRRRAEVQALIARQGLGCATRSAAELPDAQHPVYLADTLGEMPLWYDLAATTFVGGSLVARGGHTPFEPASHGSALLHGPHLDNFAEIYAGLQAAGGSAMIDSADALAHALLSLDDAARRRMTQAAATVIEALQGSAGLAPILDRLADLTGDPGLRPHHGT
ncbi:3-deoxy-D-manno-octulosonic acid transferase [Actibacterium sp. D379-3]